MTRSHFRSPGGDIRQTVAQPAGLVLRGTDPCANETRGAMRHFVRKGTMLSTIKLGLHLGLMTLDAIVEAANTPIGELVRAALAKLSSVWQSAPSSDRMTAAKEAPAVVSGGGTSAT